MNLIIEALEQMDQDGLVLRLEDLKNETIVRISIDVDTLEELIENGDITVLEEFDISYEEDWDD